MERTPAHERGRFLEQHPGWSIDGEVLSRTFQFPDFVASMSFVTGVGIIAEKAFHHPDIDIRWNRVTIALTTHDAGGLTENDLALAEAIEGLVR